MKRKRRDKRKKMTDINLGGGMEIPTARFNVGVVFNAEVMGRRSYLFENVPNTELEKLIFNIRTIGVPLIPNKDGKHELIVLPSGIAAIEVAQLEEPVLAEVVE